MVEPAASSPFAIRPAKPEDAPLILGTWLEQAFRETPWGRRVRAREFFAGHRPIVVRILERARCLIACDRQDPDTIAGYIVWEQREFPTVQMVYTKKAYRRMGIARALCRAAGLPEDLDGVRFTHGTRSWFHSKDSPGLEARFPGAVFDPYAAFDFPRSPKE